MDSYFMFLFAIVATVVTLLAVVGGGFLIYAMLVALKDRGWPI